MEHSPRGRCDDAAIAPAKKRAKQDPQELIAMHHNSFLTQRAMVDVLQHVRDNGVPSAFSRTTQYRARAKACSERTPYGPLVVDFTLDMVKGEPELIAIQSPFAILWKCANACEPYAAALRTALHRYPSTVTTPWKLLMYWDEVSPTNPLAKGKDKRKVQAVYWTFMELETLWSVEDAWFEVCAVRSDLVNNMCGGMSGLVAKLMYLFFDKDGFEALWYSAEFAQRFPDGRAYAIVRNALDHNCRLPRYHGSARQQDAQCVQALLPLSQRGRPQNQFVWCRGHRLIATYFTRVFSVQAVH